MSGGQHRWVLGSEAFENLLRESQDRAFRQRCSTARQCRTQERTAHPESRPLSRPGSVRTALVKSVDEDSPTYDLQPPTR
jgi:hypothetical protein